MKKRDTRLLDKSTFDDPNEFCEAGSSEEADIIAEWDRWELVEKIQELDRKLYVTECELNKFELVAGNTYEYYDPDKNGN